MFEDKVIPLDIWVSQFVDWLVENYRDVFKPSSGLWSRP